MAAGGHLDIGASAIPNVHVESAFGIHAITTLSHPAPAVRLLLHTPVKMSATGSC